MLLQPLDFGGGKVRAANHFFAFDVEHLDRQSVALRNRQVEVLVELRRVIVRNRLRLDRQVLVVNCQSAEDRRLALSDG